MFQSQHDLPILFCPKNKRRYENAQLGSVAGPVIQANGRLTFEDDLRSGGLLYFTQGCRPPNF